MKLGAYASAKANFKEALDINRKGLPPGHMAIAFSLPTWVWCKVS